MRISIIKISTASLHKQYIQQIKAIYRFGFSYEKNGILEFDLSNGFDFPLEEFTFYLLLEKQEPIGFLSATEVDKKTILLANFYLLPEYRKMGLGKGLISFAINDSKGKTVMVYALMASSIVEGSKGYSPYQFYKNIGFKQAGYMEEYNKYTRCLAKMLLKQ
jgi:GNAT superfamily N-acetyltransferase